MKKNRVVEQLRQRSQARMAAAGPPLVVPLNELAQVKIQNIVLQKNLLDSSLRDVMREFIAVANLPPGFNWKLNADNMSQMYIFRDMTAEESMEAAAKAKSAKPADGDGKAADAGGAA